ncbi:hypothetical protein [Thermodesulfovibrio aggregans]|nr:hypothetical protein [Thermodesulfovibrio aggregans]
MSLHKLITSKIKNFQELKTICDRCLNTERWNGNVLLMVLDAAFTSVGVNYFQVVVPKIKDFESDFVKTGKVTSLFSFANFDFSKALYIWKNSRSWNVAKQIAANLSKISNNDRESLRLWARESSIENWKSDSIGKIKGVGLITYQYLRMMGGVDTVMPDKIVKRVINEILVKTGKPPVSDNMEFIKTVEEIAKQTGYRSIELCFMSWFINQPERINEMP